METNLYTITIPPMIKALGALSALLEKAKVHADTKKTPHRSFEEALLNDRLVFDQFPFIRQVQIASDNAKNSAKRLGEVDVPTFDDTEKTVDELKMRLEKTVAFLKTVRPEDIKGKESSKVSLPYWNGKSLTGFEYATEYLIPNFYFHVTTAYSILRKNGLEIGKDDYIGGLPLKD
ncbi:DUF1993 domain-containing protein [Candidatus Kaiserbacteria bacterium]|nr:DUF1993 domain-containing protein [Candidatus Kaiserbacteria bacterium]